MHDYKSCILFIRVNWFSIHVMLLFQSFVNPRLSLGYLFSESYVCWVFFLPESNYVISAVFDNWTTINCSSKWLILFASTFLHRNTSAETRKILFMASHLIYLNWYINSVQCVWQKFSTDRLFENEIMPTVDKKNLIVQISFALLNFS